MFTSHFGSGVRATVPLMIGVIPFGLAYGIMATQADMSLMEIVLMSCLVFAGSAQFMAVDMIGNQVNMMFIVFSTLLINLRHLLMGLSLTPYLKHLKPSMLSLLAFGMVDESYAASITHFQNDSGPGGRAAFMLGSASGMYLFWVVSGAVGGILGKSIKDPLSWGLDFAMAATFLSILIPQIKSMRVFVVILVSSVCTVAAYCLIPGKWYILIATVAATVTGTLLELNEERRSAKCKAPTSL